MKLRNVKSLSREDFNKAVLDAAAKGKGLGLGERGVNALIFYSYIDDNGKEIKLVCYEETPWLSNKLSNEL